LIRILETQNQRLVEASNIIEAQARIEELEEEIQTLQEQLENSTVRDNCPPQEEAEESFFQELSRKENLDSTKEELRKQISNLTQQENESIEEARNITQLVRAIRLIFASRRLLGTPIELPNFGRTNSESSYFTDRPYSLHRRTVSLFNPSNFSMSSSPSSSRRSSLILSKREEKEREKDVEIEELKTKNLSLEKKINDLKNELQKREEKEDFSPNQQDQPSQNNAQDEETQQETANQQIAELISFLDDPKVLGFSLTISFTVIGGLI